MNNVIATPGGPAQLYKNDADEPLFLVKVQVDTSAEITERDIKQVEPDDFKLPPHGDSKPEEFDLTCHLELEV